MMTPIAVGAPAAPSVGYSRVGIALNSIKAASEEYKNRSRKASWLNDPDKWVRERLGMHLWSKQREIAASVRDNKMTAVKSCHDSGKTFLAALLVCWWIDTRPDDQTMVVSTAPTAEQVTKLLWEYIRQLHKKHNLSGTVDEAAQWKSNAPNRFIVGYGRKPADANIHGFQGMHRKYVFVIMDEACGIPDSIWTGVDTITTNPNNRVLAIGNPDDPATEFGRIFQDQNQEAWSRHTISAYDTPNFTEEKYELPEGMAENLLDPDWVQDKERRWGKNSSRYIAKVLAEFPAESFDTLFPPAKLQNAIGINLEEDGQIRNDEIVRFGVDVARFGGDLTAVVSNYGGKVRVVDAWDKADTVESANRIHLLATQHGAKEVRVDGTGLGAGVVDQLRRLCGDQYLVYEMIGSERAPDKFLHINARAYWHDTFLKKLNANMIDLPFFRNDQSYEQVMYEDLEVIRYMFKKGALQVEGKDEIRKRVKKSPDFSDAVIYACADLDPMGLLSQMHPGETIMVNPMDQFVGDRGFAISPW